MRQYGDTRLKQLEYCSSVATRPLQTISQAVANRLGDDGGGGLAAEVGRENPLGGDALDRFHGGLTMPGSTRAGRTLAYWSNPWQIGSRSPHSDT